MVFGEINTKANINVEQLVRNAVKEVGYDDINKGMDYKSMTVIVHLDQQSPEIFDALHTKEEKPEEIGAGDQGLMIGYASNETKECMPLTHMYAQKLAKRLQECREQGVIPWLRPDGKTQVTIQYKTNEDGMIEPVRIHTILLSVQHNPNISNKQIEESVKEHVVNHVIDSKYLDESTIYYINPSGQFIIGGPTGDAGLTGRKIIVDTYGGWGGHGGGAFSGKDGTKVDRSAAYAARWVAKSLVANGLCKRALVEVAYGIGIPHPISLFVNTYGTAAKGTSDHQLGQIVLKNFDLRTGCIIRDLGLKQPFFKKISSYGHFGRDEAECKWEIAKDLSNEINRN